MPLVILILILATLIIAYLSKLAIEADTMPDLVRLKSLENQRLAIIAQIKMDSTKTVRAQDSLSHQLSLRRIEAEIAKYKTTPAGIWKAVLTQ